MVLVVEFLETRTLHDFFDLCSICRDIRVAWGCVFMEFVESLVQEMTEKKQLNLYTKSFPLVLSNYKSNYNNKTGRDPCVYYNENSILLRITVHSRTSLLSIYEPTCIHILIYDLIPILIRGVIC